MNKNCIILEIHGADVGVISLDYDGPAQRFTEEEAAVEIDQLNREMAYARFQIVRVPEAP